MVKSGAGDYRRVGAFATECRDYPRDRLDIKLVLEANDIATQALIRDEDLPDHMEVIVVPRGGPQTKPKALNYALQFARGELITVFDAEDLPDPDDLLAGKAAVSQ
jgi:cellulose synthase/poly-beta-1,6-N-acetylglucosamine synthase-like glycosyltransferase